MKEVTIIGVDLAKQVFQLHGATAEGEVVFARSSRASSFSRSRIRDSGASLRWKPVLTVPADRDDHGGLAVDDGGVAAAGVIGAIGGHGADLFVLGDLVEQLWQDRAVAVATGRAIFFPQQPEADARLHCFGAVAPAVTLTRARQVSTSSAVGSGQSCKVQVR